MRSHDAAALHEWRIDIRKLRYLIEVYSPVLAKTRSAKLPKKLSRLQNILGAMNDIAMAHRRVEAALTRKRSNAASLHQALRNWQTTRLRFLTKKLRSQWRKIRRDKKLWRRFESAAR
jgi:CHAD domain-containing protein